MPDPTLPVTADPSRLDAPPRHRHEMTLRLGANSPTELCERLRWITDDLEREDLDQVLNVTSSQGYHLVIEYDPTMKPERYDSELKTWCAARRIERSRALAVSGDAPTSTPGSLDPSPDAPTSVASAGEVSHQVARLTRAEFDDLLDYSCSIPTGTTIGKRWKRRCDYNDESKGWVLGEYVEHPNPDRVGIVWQDIEVVDPEIVTEAGS